MKKISIFLLILSVIACCVSISVFAAEATNTYESTVIKELPMQDNSAVADGSHSLDALYPLLGSEKLVDNVRSAVVYESNSQTLMYAWNPDAQMYPASFVKLMTALLAIEKADLTDIVTVTQAAVSSVPYDAVSAKLVADEKLSLEDLLYCLLLGSANDAGAVIAEHVSDSQSAFVDEMNRYAQELGCTGTHFTNAHGLHDDNQHTTARDAAKILDAALKNPIFKTIFTADAYTVKATNLSPERVLSNGNSMKDTSSKLYYDARVIGGRTGITKDGRRCLATAAENNGMLVIGIVMGSESVYQEDGYTAIRVGGYKETTQLFDACLDGYKTAQVLYAGQALRQISVAGAPNELVIGPQTSISTILPEEISFANLSFRYDDKAVTLPVEKGQYISDVQIWHGNMCVAQAELYALHELRSEQIDQDAESKSANRSLPIALWIVVSIAFVVAFVYLLIRFSGKLKTLLCRWRTKRYRRSRKRVR